MWRSTSDLCPPCVCCCIIMFSHTVPHDHITWQGNSIMILSLAWSYYMTGKQHYDTQLSHSFLLDWWGIPQSAIPTLSSFTFPMEVATMNSISVGLFTCLSISPCTICVCACLLQNYTQFMLGNLKPHDTRLQNLVPWSRTISTSWSSCEW